MYHVSGKIIFIEYISRYTMFGFVPMFIYISDLYLLPIVHSVLAESTAYSDLFVILVFVARPALLSPREVFVV